MPSPDSLQSYDSEIANWQRLSPVVQTSFDGRDLDDQEPVDWKHIEGAVAVAAVLQEQVVVGTGTEEQCLQMK